MDWCIKAYMNRTANATHNQYFSLTTMRHGTLCDFNLQQKE
jgi:hypothetical protein